MIRPRHQPRGHGAVAVLVLGLLLSSGCASRPAGPVTGRFVKPGEPVMEFGKGRAPTGDSLQAHIRKVRHLSAGARPRPTTFGGTIEASDRRLAAALLVEAILPTAQSQVQVAEEYRRLGVLDSAHARLNRAIRTDPAFAPAHESMARVWRDWGLPGFGLGPAYRAVHHAPGSASARNTLGTILDALGRPDAAREAYQRAAMMEPTAAWALNNLCHLEFTLGRLEAARLHCEAALRVTPASTATHNNLALTYAAAGDMVRAYQEFQAAGDQAAAEYNSGIVHLSLGDHAAAARSFEAAIDFRPSFTAAKVRAREARMHVLTQPRETVQTP